MTVSELFRGEFYSFLYIGYFLLCCVYLWTAAYAVVMRKLSFIVSSLLLFTFCFLGLQTAKYSVSDIHNIYMERFFRYAGVYPVFFHFIILLLLSAYALILAGQIRTWRQHNITLMSIRKCGDGHPAGIVFWRNSGRVLYSNAAADRISVSLTGSPIMNGCEFFEAMGRSPVKLPDGSVWSYQHRIVVMDRELLHELTAVNISELYRKTEELEEDTKRLRKMNQDLNEYNRQIEELVRRKEILNAKVHIHDEMNHLLMATVRGFEGHDRKKQEEILKSWRNNAFLLFNEQKNERSANILEDLRTYGELAGIRFICSSMPMLPDQEQMRFVVLCAREAMNNAVKHGEARVMKASFAYRDHMLVCTFENDGRIPENEKIVPSGGLLHLQKEAGRFGGRLETKCTDVFQLIISIPEGGSADESIFRTDRRRSDDAAKTV